MSSPNRVTDDYLDAGSSLPSLPTEKSEDNTDSDHDGEKDNQSEDGLKETDFRQDEEAGDDEEDEVFDEVVLNPRPLNEVTSLTDRTSPWTSILSDPDMVSVDSVEAPKESNMSEDEDKSLVVNLESNVPNRKQTENVCHHSSDESAKDSDRDDNTVLHSADQTQDKELNSPKKSDVTSPTPQPTTCTHSAPGTKDMEQNQLLPYP